MFCVLDGAAAAGKYRLPRTLASGMERGGEGIGPPRVGKRERKRER